jgi:hypothetical protein
MNKFNS